MARAVTGALEVLAAAARMSLRAMALTVIAATLLSGSPAQAQAWREYRYAGFAIQFPVEPTIENGLYTTEEGTTADAQVFSARQAGAFYKLTVADLSRARLSEAQVLREAIAQLTADSEVVVDVPHRVNRV